MPLPMSSPGPLSLTADALADIAAGKFVVVTDDADRENEGDLIMAADRMTEEAMAFMVRVFVLFVQDTLLLSGRIQGHLIMAAERMTA